MRDADALAIAAERATLGAMMLAADAVSTARGILSAADFALPRHASAFAAICAVADRGEPAVPLPVAAELERRGASADLGYLVDLAESTLTGAGAEHDARLVVEHANRRRIVAGARAALELAGEGREASALAEVLRPAVDGATRNTTAGTRQSLVEPIESLLALPPARWLLDGLRPEAGVALLVAPPNVGKSTLALDWAMRVAAGSDWHGRSMLAGPVAYFAGEGRRGIGQRAAAWLAAHDATLAHRLDLVTRTPPLSQPEGQRELAAIVAEARPRFVVIDTVSSLWGGQSENDSDLAAPFLAFLAGLADRYESTFLALHHPRKPGNAPQAASAEWAAPRGSGAWTGSPDAVLSLSGPPEDLKLSTVKQRDGERLPPIALRLVVADLPAGGSSVVVAPGSPSPVASAESVDAQRARDVERLLAAVDELGGEAPSKDAIALQAGIRLQRARALVDVAVRMGRLRNAGTPRKPRFVRGACVQESTKEGTSGTSKDAPRLERPDRPRTAGDGGDGEDRNNPANRIRPSQELPAAAATPGVPRV
ncbi:MAG: AAA family ATPase [Planctomycetota bacterium]